MAKTTFRKLHHIGGRCGSPAFAEAHLSCETVRDVISYSQMN